jgi:hypothetical protein
MHLTGITKRASCLISVREPAQPVANTPKSEVNRTTAKLPGRNTTAIPPLHAIRSVIPRHIRKPDLSYDGAVVVPKPERIQIIAACMSCLSGLDKVGCINATFCTQEKNDKHDAKKRE